jgi:Mg2+ and Co2+ transporter CorA
MASTNKESDAIYKISKLKKENKNLQSLLESAEAEIKSIIRQSQEESKQLQKALQFIQPKIEKKAQMSSIPQKCLQHLLINSLNPLKQTT